MRSQVAALAALLMSCVQAQAEDITVRREPAADYKAVFATVEARETVPARVRTGGTIAQLLVRRGEAVHRGELIATVGDPKLVFNQNGLKAEIAALAAQLTQTRADLVRLQTLAATGAASRTSRDQTQTQVQVQQNMLQAKTAQLGAVSQQLAEGSVLAPTDGRIIDLPYTVGTVVSANEAVATVAVAGYVLLLRVPEEHARFLKVGDPVRLDAADLGRTGDLTGTVSLVYPRIEDGRVIAEAEVPGLSDDFVGGRVRVWVTGAPRDSIVIPARAVLTRFGLDYVRLRQGKDIVEVPVQRGEPSPRPGMPDGLEILSGLSNGDIVAAP
jgi:RND family efflux transporter MFP subunit